MDTIFQGEAVGRTCCYGLAGVVRRKGRKKHASRRTWFFLSVSWCWLLAFREENSWDFLLKGSVRSDASTRRVWYLFDESSRWTYGTLMTRVWRKSNLLHVFWGPCWKMGDNFGRLVERSSVLYLVSSRFDEFLRLISGNACLCMTWDDYWQVWEHSTGRWKPVDEVLLKKNREKKLFLGEEL